MNIDRPTREGLDSLLSPAPIPELTRISIAEGTAAYLAICEGAKIAPATLRKYRTFVKQLREFAHARERYKGVWTSEDVEEFIWVLVDSDS